MKQIDEHYKDWCGTSRVENSVKLVHDSTEAIEFAEYYHTEQLRLHVVSVSFERRQKLAESILLALLQNPERYKYISKKVESGDLKQEDANMKNINKAYKIADSFLSVGENMIGKPFNHKLSRGFKKAKPNKKK